MGTTEDVAGTIMFPCSPQSSYVNGQNISVDGGFSVLGIEPEPLKALVAQLVAERRELRDVAQPVINPASAKAIRFSAWPPRM